MKEKEALLYRSHEHILSRFLWLKLLFTLGLYFFWWRSSVLELTDQRIVVRSGFLTKKERSVPLSKVQDITITVGPVGRIFGFGDMRIESAGSGSTEISVFQYSGVQRIRKMIMER